MPIESTLVGIARVAVPNAGAQLLRTVAGSDPLLGVATSFLRGVGNALTNLVQHISSSFLGGDNLNIANNPPLGPFGQASNFLDRTARGLSDTARGLSDFAQRLQQFSQRLQNISSALTKLEEALKTLMDAITGRTEVEDRVRRAQVSAP